VQEAVMVIFILILICVVIPAGSFWLFCSVENDLERKGIPPCEICGRRSHHIHNG
jgi:hypothetical protein